MQPPEIRYARSGDLHIAYQVVGDGPIDVAFMDQWFGNVEAQWDFPPLARLLEKLSSFSRLIVFDKRGTGLSDPVAIDDLPTLEVWMDDLRAVLDEVGSTRTALVSGIGSTYMTMLFAATFPERTSALVMIDGNARLGRAPDYPFGRDLSALPEDLERIRANWGRGVLAHFLAPELVADPELLRSFSRYERQSGSPGVAAAMIQLLYDSDLRHVLPAIRVPTLVIQHAQTERLPPAIGRYVAEHIEGARYVEVAGNSSQTWAGDQDATLAEIQEFLTGSRPAPEIERVLATVLFTDIVDSTKRAAELGDRKWRNLLDAHHRVVRSALQRFRGREVKTTGDGFLATFDGPARAVRCAQEIAVEMSNLGVQVRAGLHTGEIELTGDDVAGIAVHIAARVSALAGPGEVLASSTVRDLVAGSGIVFEDRGTHALKGVPDEWRIVAAVG